MSKKWFANVAALCACLMLTGVACAEEKHLGNLIYVPAMQAQAAVGAMSLRVEGLALEQESDAPVIRESVAGAEFGVYVVSGAGELTPWANPLYPSEQMRIRTGEGETRFTLPQGAEYYLIQESAPQGYIFDPTAVIPVSGEEIVVRNAMAGQLVISAVDTLGSPVAGVTLSVKDEDGKETLLTTDKNGEAVLLSEAAQAFEIEEAGLPEGVFSVLRVSGAQELESGAFRAQTQLAERTRVVFEHPASGSVLLDMKLLTHDDNAQEVYLPLDGVKMEILGENPVEIVTDDQGQARASLLEGTYDVRLSYEGDKDVLLPLEAGQMIVQSGATTVIELSAVLPVGRIVLRAQSEKALSGGGVTFADMHSGKTFGPYALDAEGMAVSDPLPAGSYRIAEFTAPQGMQTGGFVCEGETAQSADGLTIPVEAGRISRVETDLLSRQTQRFALMMQSVDENGEQELGELSADLELTLEDENGQEIAVLDAQSGAVSVEALSGSYRLVMKEKDARKLGVQTHSSLFALPSDEEAVVFACEGARLILSSVNEQGIAAPHAVYLLTDSTGKQYEILCDEDGMAVTPLLAQGEVRIETISAPAQHSAADTVVALAASAQANAVQMTHMSHGTVQISLRVQSLNELGETVYAPLSGVHVNLYRAEEDGRTTDTGVVQVTDESGSISVRLEAGAYVAVADERDFGGGVHGAEAASFTVEDAKETAAELTAYDALGGVRIALSGGSLSDEQLAQVRFELTAKDGAVKEMSVLDGTFYAGALEAGEYVLCQTQMPQGYALMKERTITVSGGKALEVTVALEEYAVLHVSKTGLTFDNRMNTYIVPLSGEYGVFVMDNEGFKPYPSEETQLTVWANVTPQQMVAGKAGSVKLPASVEGTTYYLHELGGAEGFETDDTYYEVTLHAGETTTLDCTVSSDRGFFRMQALDGHSLAHVPGGSFELLDAVSGEVVLAFEVGDAPYQNPMAVPVGSYVLRQTKAAPGYALSVPNEIDVVVEPYLTQGGTVAEVTMTAAAIPQNEELDLIREVYAAEQQGLTLLCVDTAKTGSQDALAAPSMTIRVGAAGSERSDIASVVIAGTGDEAGGVYRARVEYCLEGGGWQPSDARMTGVLMGPEAVSLADVSDDISAVRVTFLNANTGEEAVGGGFTPGQISLNVEASAQGALNMTAEVDFEGLFVYQTEANGETKTVERRAEANLPFTMQAKALFDTVSAGQDGRISGVVFFDADADGVMDLEETVRYAGMNVSLLSASGDVLNTTRTDADGRYAFDAISSGVYSVRFDAGDQVVFSRGDLYSAHMISGIEDTRFGASAEMRIDGDHTDYVVNVGCIYAAEVSGAAFELMKDGTQAGFSGLPVEMRALSGDEDEEPILVVTEGTGEFRFARLLPGTYEFTLEVPAGYLCRDAQDGRITRVITVEAGGVELFGMPVFEKAAALSGTVRVDSDGDGVMEEESAPAAGVRVTLLRAEDGHTQEAAQTVTDANGFYAFEKLLPGEYSVLFELGGEWAFTRYGGGSQVYGAVSQSGSTKTFELAAGEEKTGIDAGITIPAKLTVSVFKDTQYDGRKGVYEEMLSGVSLSLIRVENGAEAEAIVKVTDAAGTVTFDGVSPGEYVLGYEMPGQWRTTKQVDAADSNYPVSDVPQSAERTGRSAPFVLTMGQMNARMSIGAMLSGTISGMVYYDDNDNAKREEGENACAGVLVELMSGEEALRSTVSAEDGAYIFEGLAPGRYTVRFTAQSGCGFSGTERTAVRGGVQASDSNVSSTRPVSISSDVDTMTCDAGVVRLGTVSGTVWEDRNGNRKIDEGEAAMEGMPVNLMDGSGRNILAKTTTDAQGRFIFEGLKPDSYKLRVDGREGYVFSGALDGGVLPLENERDGRGYSESFTLLGGVHVDQIGFGLLTQGVISGSVWEDADYSGVWEAGEEGLRGVSVALIDANGVEVAARQTVRSGEFSFDRLMPGRYTLRVTLEEGYAFTCDGGDSAAAHTVEQTADVDVGELSMGGAIENIRIGALRSASVRGTIWYDEDDDGRRKENDEGMSGVRVVLTMTGGADDGLTIETETDADGVYRFDGVMPGSAKVAFELEDGFAFSKKIDGTRRVSVVPQANALTAETAAFDVAAGSSYADMDVGVVGVGTVSGCVWEDMVYDGRRGDGEAGVSGVLAELVDRVSGNVAASAYTDENGEYVIDFARKGEYVLRLTLEEDMIFTCVGDGVIAGIDASAGQTEGFALGMGESAKGFNAGAIHPAVISGRMAVDLNENGVSDPDEPGFAGGVVTVMQGGTALAAVSTGEDGSFSFNMLRPGTYRLRYALDPGALFSRGAQLNMTDPDALEGETAEIVMEIGQKSEFAAVPVVIAGEISGRAFADANVNSVMDADETAMTDVTVELLDAQGAVVESVKTDAAGAYAFTQLRSGTYAVRFTLPENMLFTDFVQADGASCVPVVPGHVGETQRFTLGMGEKRGAMNVGGILPGRIGETAWLDSNGNGLQDYKEPLIPGVTLTLIKVEADGREIESAKATSDEYGYFWFESLRPGTYVLKAELREGDTLTFSFGDPMDEIDSNLDPDTGLSEPIMLKSGQTIRNADVGFTDYGKE